MKFTCPIDWDSLRISPQSIEAPEKKETVKKAGKAKADEPATDLPWDA